VVHGVSREIAACKQVAAIRRDVNGKQYIPAPQAFFYLSPPDTLCRFFALQFRFNGCQRGSFHMDTRAGIRWLRVLLAGFLAELLVIALVIPPALLLGKNTLAYTAPLASLLACFALSIWVGRRLDSRFVLHGILVGVVATLIYVALTRGGPEPPAYIFAHGLKLLGGAAGGLVAARRQKPVQQLNSPAGETPHP
jgi:putative membrane protein (TIGR04086 family)